MIEKSVISCIFARRNFENFSYIYFKYYYFFFKKVLHIYIWDKIINTVRIIIALLYYFKIITSLYLI